MERIEVRERAPLFGLALAAGVGVWVGLEGGLAPWVWVMTAVVGALPAWWGGTRWRVAGLWLVAAGAFGLYASARAHGWAEDHVVRQVGEEARGWWVRFRVEEDGVVRRMRDGGKRTEFNATLEARLDESGGWRRLEGRVAGRMNGEGDFRAGEVWEGAVFLERPMGPMNPGQFDYRGWLEARGLSHGMILTPGQVVRVRAGPGWGWRVWAGMFRRHMRETLELGMAERPQGAEASALMAGMLFGFRDGISEPLKHAFRVTGTMHLFAVSGQNVGVVLGVLMLVLQVVGVVRWRWAWVLLPLVLVFCLSTGMEASAFRAFLMAGLVAVGWVLYRPVGLFNLLGAAALGMWLWDPRVLADLGFQLSFCVVAGIGWMTGPLHEWMKRWGAPDPWVPRRLVPWWRRWAEAGWEGGAGLAAVSVAAWLAALPLTLGHFHLFSPVAVVANMVVVPLASGVLVLSVFAVLLGIIWEGLAVAANGMSYWLLRGVMAAVTYLASLPGGHWYVGAPGSGPDQGVVRMTVLHWRQASPAVVEGAGQAWLLDPGPEGAWRQVVDPFRAWRGINRWEGVVLGHGGTRRLGSAVEVLEGVPVGWWAEAGWRSRSRAQHEWLGAMERAGVGKRFWRRGDRLELAPGVEVEVLHPGEEEGWERLEDRGLVVKWRLNGHEVLWAGDISTAVEEELVRRGLPLGAKVLVQGEHPQRPGPGVAWLEAVRPEVVVRPGRGYHPDRGLGPEFWAATERLGARVLRLDRTGAVVLDFTAGEVRVETFLGR